MCNGVVFGKHILITRTNTLKQHNPINNLITKLIVISILAILVGCENRKNIANTVDLKNGDIIFRKGNSKGSVAVMIGDKGGKLYTHVGVIVEYRGVLMALHTVPDEAERGAVDKVKLEPIEDFFKDTKAVKGAVYRTPLSADEMNVVTEQCLFYYYTEVPFDHDYNINDTTELYCTELLCVSFKKVGYDITAGNSTYLNTILFNGRYVFPSDIIRNRDMKHIYSY